MLSAGVLTNVTRACSFLLLRKIGNGYFLQDFFPCKSKNLTFLGHKPRYARHGFGLLEAVLHSVAQASLMLAAIFQLSLLHSYKGLLLKIQDIVR